MESVKRSASVTTRRDVRIHAELWHTSYVLLTHGQEKREGSTHQYRASLVFTAFALEAYLNWLGAKRLANWEQDALERLNPYDKTEEVATKLRVVVDFGKRPWSILNQLFGFRNDIAHGKPELLEKTGVEAVDAHLDKKLGRGLETWWERFCTPKNAVRAREDVETIAQRLHDAAGFDSSESTYPFVMGLQTGSATLMPKE